MVKIEETIFRRYDIRGKYPHELNEEAAYYIALAYSNLFPDVKRVVVGCDIRRSSPSLKKAVIQGLIHGGKDVTDAGTVTTPMLYFSVCHYKFDGGIQVTASHLTSEYNGLKLHLKNAYPLVPEDFDKMKKLIVEDKLKKVETHNDRVEKLNPEEDYVEYITGKVKLKRPLRIIVDVGNGTVGRIPEKILKKLGCNVTTMYAEPDDSFPHHVADPYKEENMRDLRKKVCEDKADLGIAYDGDGDRTGIVDSKGNDLSGDHMLMIFSRNALRQERGPIVCDVRASLALIEDVRRQNQEIVFTVGYHTAVLDKIIELNAVFGGETTGHYYFPLEYYLIDDGVFSSLKIVEAAAETDDFSAYVSSLPEYHTSEEVFIDFPDTEKYEAVERFTKMVKQNGYEVIDVDGARIGFENGWGIVRAANTSPYIKVKFEGRTKKDLTEVAKKVIALMDECGIKMPEKNKKALGL